MQSDLWRYREGQLGSDVVGYKVEAVDGDIGKIDEATDEAGSGRIVVDTGPWIFGRKVVLPAGVIERIDPAEKKVFVSRTKDEIKDAPEIDDELGFSEDYRATLDEYYGQPVGMGRTPGGPI